VDRCYKRPSNLPTTGAPALSYSSTPTATLGQNIGGLVGVDDGTVLITLHDLSTAVSIVNLLAGIKATVLTETISAGKSSAASGLISRFF